MIPDDVLSRTLLAFLITALTFLALVIAIVVVSGRSRRLDDAASWTDLGVVDIPPADLDRLIEQLDALDAGRSHYPCRPDQACDDHDPGRCPVSRCCPNCPTSPVRRGAPTT